MGRLFAFILLFLVLPPATAAGTEGEWRRYDTGRLAALARDANIVGVSHPVFAIALEPAGFDGARALADLQVQPKPAVDRVWIEILLQPRGLYTVRKRGHDQSLTLSVALRDDRAVIAAEQADGSFRISPLLRGDALWTALAEILRLPAGTMALPGPRQISAQETLILRALHEHDLHTRLLLGEEAADLGGWLSLGEIHASLAGRSFQNLIELYPLSRRLELQALTTDRLPLAAALRLMVDDRGVRRQAIAGGWRYRLGPAGRELARRLFSPVWRVDFAAYPLPAGYRGPWPVHGGNFSISWDDGGALVHGLRPGGDIELVESAPGALARLAEHFL